MMASREFESQSQAYQQKQHAVDERGRAMQNIGTTAQGTTDRGVENQRYEREFQLKAMAAKAEMQERAMRMAETQRRLQVMGMMSVAEQAQAQTTAAHLQNELTQEHIKAFRQQTEQNGPGGRDNEFARQAILRFSGEAMDDYIAKPGSMMPTPGGGVKPFTSEQIAAAKARIATRESRESQDSAAKLAKTEAETRRAGQPTPAMVTATQFQIQRLDKQKEALYSQLKGVGLFTPEGKRLSEELRIVIRELDIYTRTMAGFSSGNEDRPIEDLIGEAIDKFDTGGNK